MVVDEQNQLFIGVEFRHKIILYFRTKFTNEHFSFALSLNAYLAEKDDSAMSPGCTDGKTRVCQYEPAGSLKRPIGTEIKESFYGGKWK